MAEPNSAPHAESDPATTANAKETHDQDTDEQKPRDSNGWDGKLRVDRMTLTDEPRDPHAQILSDPEVSDDEGPPPEQLAADEDLLDDVPDDEEEIELVHCKVSDMSSLRLERFKQMKVCRSWGGTRTRRSNIAASLPSPKPNRKYCDTRRTRIKPYRSRPL